VYTGCIGCVRVGSSYSPPPKRRFNTALNEPLGWPLGLLSPPEPTAAPAAFYKDSSRRRKPSNRLLWFLAVAVPLARLFGRAFKPPPGGGLGGGLN